MTKLVLIIKGGKIHLQKHHKLRKGGIDNILVTINGQGLGWEC